MTAMPDSGHHRKRRRSFRQNHLRLGYIVEVRSIEEGFLGSWHVGTIIAFKKGYPEVKYKHLLQDNGSDKLTEIIEVNSTDSSTSTTCERGRIRPNPLLGVLTKENICYGLCVDCDYMDAWWEGVVFDHEEGSSERKIFFPDLGDEMIFDVKDLRLTHDWDGLGGWKCRGKWLFLEMFEEFERVRFIPVSLKQIWYDIRERKEFGGIGEWPSPVKTLWQKLISQVINDNLRLTVYGLLQGCLTSKGMSDNCEVASIMDSTPNLDLISMDSHAVVAPARGIGLQDGDSMRENEASFAMASKLCENAEPAMDLQGSAPTSNQLVPVHPKTISVLCSDQKCFDSSIMPQSQLTNNSKSDEMQQLRRNKRKLHPDQGDFNIKPMFCPVSMYEYLLSSSRPTLALTDKVRCHLCCMGYKFEHCYKKKFIRYTSPEGRKFYNLRKCVKFEITRTRSALAEEDIQRGMISSTSNLNCTPLLKAPNTSTIEMITEKTPAEEDIQRGNISSPADLKCTPLFKAPNTSVVHIEPKYCPELVDKYLRSFKKRKVPIKYLSKLQHEVRRHLAAVGWNVWTTSVRQGKNEWRYDSPTSDKTYYSLVSVCKAMLGGVKEMRSSSPTVDAYCENPKRLSDGEISLFDKEACGFSLSKNWSRKFPRSLTKYKAGKLHRRKRIGLLHSTPSLIKNGEQEQEAAIRRLSTRFLSKKKKALGRVKNSSDSSNMRLLRSSKRVRQAEPSITSQAPRTVLSWLIDNGAVMGREKIYYHRQGDDQPIAEGRITNYGIACSCCRQVFSLSGFEAHAGSNSYQPAVNIFFQKDGKSLVQRQLEMMHQKIQSLSREQPERARGKRHKSWNDHVCSVCQYGGELILCDRCPSSFHARCLGFQDIPEGDWFCPSCCCGICDESYADVNTEYSTENVLSCCQCERLYHAHCIRERDVVKLDVHPTENWFCSKMCEKDRLKDKCPKLAENPVVGSLNLTIGVHWGLQQLLGKPILVGHDSLTWTLTKPMDYQASHVDDCDVIAMAENYCKLSVALEVMHECFEPVKEPRTRRDLVEDVIFCRRSHLNRLNFRGFYTVLLERNDELITVAILRVYGDQVAEIPLIGTRFKHRRLGMCRIVVQEIEKNLIELGVKRLVLPAAASVLNTWTTAFGYVPVTKSERTELLSYCFLDFQDTIMCQKLLKKIPLPLPKLSIKLRLHVPNKSGVHQNIEGTSIIADPQGTSAISEVSQEDRLDGGAIVVQETPVNGTEEKSSSDSDNGQVAPNAMVVYCHSPNQEFETCNSEESKEEQNERNTCDGIIKFYKRKKAVELRPSVSQSKYPKVQVSCR